MRGKKYSDEVKEKAYMMYAVCGNIAEVAKSLKVPANTISVWLKNKRPDEFDELRAEKKREFVEQSSDIIDKAMTLLERRIDRALEKEAVLDEVIDAIEDMGGDELSQKTKQRLIGTIEMLKIQDIRSLTTAIGTLYDKRALAKGESTENTSVTFKLPEGIMKYAE